MDAPCLQELVAEGCQSQLEISQAQHFLYIYIHTPKIPTNKLPECWSNSEAIPLIAINRRIFGQLGLQCFRLRLSLWNRERLLRKKTGDGAFRLRVRPMLTAMLVAFSKAQPRGRVRGRSRAVGDVLRHVGHVLRAFSDTSYTNTFLNEVINQHFHFGAAENPGVPGERTRSPLPFGVPCGAWFRLEGPDWALTVWIIVYIKTQY